MRSRLALLLVCLSLAAAGIFGMPSPPGRKAYAQSGNGGIVLLASGWNISAVTSGNRVFATNLVPSQAGSVIRIAVVLGSSVPFAVYETDGTNTATSYFNGGTSLTAGCVYTFVYEVRNKNAIGGPTANPTAFNFVVGGTTVPVLRVTEVIGPVD